MTPNEKINITALLVDICQQYIIEIESATPNKKIRFDYKNTINQIKRGADKIIKLVDEVHDMENSIIFGENADELREVIENHIKK